MTIEDKSQEVIEPGYVRGKPSRRIPTRDEIIEIGRGSGIESFAKELLRIYDEQNLAAGATLDSS